MTARADRIGQFLGDGEASEGTLAKLLCEESRRHVYAPFPCRWTGGAWLNERTAQPIDADVLGWREWKVNR